MDSEFLFGIHGEDMVFLICSINRMNHINGFANTKPSSLTSVFPDPVSCHYPTFCLPPQRSRPERSVSRPQQSVGRGSNPLRFCPRQLPSWPRPLLG